MFSLLQNNFVSFHSTANIKCGEIFCQSSTDFTIICNFCEIKCFNFEDFAIHMKNIHFDEDLIKTDDMAKVETTIDNTEPVVENEPSSEDDYEEESKSGIINWNISKEDVITNDNNEDNSWPATDCSTEAEEEYIPKKKKIKTKTHKCEKCEKTYKNKTQLRMHIKREHGPDDNESAESVINQKCVECDQIFATQKKLDEHISKKHTIFKCSHCDKEFKYRHLLNRHEVIHTGVKNFVCDFENCKKRFFTRRHLTSHKHLHTDMKNFICDKCGYSCRNKETLVIHYRTHTGEKPYECNICQKAFASSSLLSEHKASHATDRPHICDVCGATFSRPKALYHHKYLHLGIKTFVCKICEKAYAQASGLAAHMRKHREDWT